MTDWRESFDFFLIVALYRQRQPRVEPGNPGPCVVPVGFAPEQLLFFFIQFPQVLAVA
jgi:hypothetical protein